MAKVQNKKVTTRKKRERKNIEIYVKMIKNLWMFEKEEKTKWQNQLHKKLLEEEIEKI